MNCRRLFAWALVFCALLFFADLAYAEAGKKVIKKTLIDFMVEKHIVEIFIILMSVAGFALVIMFFINIRRDALVPPDLLAHLEELFENDDFEEAYNSCEANPSFLASVIASGLQKMDFGYDEMEKSMIETGDEESNRLHQQVGYVSLIASIAPMMGLLGTVMGMHSCFKQIAGLQVSPKPSDLADGIYAALTTTILGLLVAIPMTAFYLFFRNRITNSVVEVGNVTEELTERFRAQPSA